MTTSLSDRALLVTLNISQWSARKLDRQESETVERNRGAVRGAARVNKSLLPMAHSLDVIHKLTGTIRTDYYRHTLPWMDGMGIIKADAYLAFTQMMSAHKAKWEAAVAKFVADYPDLQDDARHLLGDLYKDDDYPDPSQIAGKFQMDVSFFPVPDASDWRVSLSDSELDALRQQVNEQVQQSQGKAMQEAWQRVYDIVAKAHTRLKDPEAIFRDSLVENARELVALLPSLNLTDDPQLETLRRDVEGALCQHEPQVLREDKTVRSATADRLAEIMSQMGGMYAAG